MELIFLWADRKEDTGVKRMDEGHQGKVRFIAKSTGSLTTKKEKGPES